MMSFRFHLPAILTFPLLFATSLFASVTVSSPTSGATVSSPVHYIASASSTCSSGVASVGIYVNNQRVYVVKGATLNTDLSLSPGAYRTAVQEWDSCGGSTVTPVNITVAAQSGVSVSSPANNSSVTSPVTYVASASTSTCSRGIASMGIYVNNSLQYVVNGARLSTQLPLSSGTQYTAVQAWDYCGGSTHTSITLNVKSSTPGLQGVVKHVFVIMLENKGYAQTFGSGSAAPYLSQTLVSRGQLLTNYYGIGHNSLDNYIAMISGQAPDSQTQADCSTYKDFSNSNTFASYGQIIGQGCVYPAAVSTIANQLQASGRTWRGYMESMPSACLHPALNAQDPYQGILLNGYATRHNPFVYFHSLIDNSSCSSSDLPLNHLSQDLASIATTPNLSYIVPNICHDGHDAPCRDGEPGGLVSADAFLKQWVPLILNSPAYKQDGALIITFDEADSGSPNPAQSCCNEVAGPNAAMPGITGPGGGRVGAVVLSPFVKPGTQNGTPYNHYSLLKTMEVFFGFPYLGYAQPSNLSAFGKDVFGLAP